MKPIRAACLIAMSVCVAPQAIGGKVSEYKGICDASAAVALGRDYFAVADDERNTLVTYRRGRPSPVASLQLAAFLGTAADKESDLEGAAAIGSRIYWISSHGRNKNGKVREERYRFFATDVDPSTVPPSLRAVAAPYTRLLDDLLSADTLKDYGLRDAAQRAPKSEGGLNIEGLAATPDGKLLVGFRNPLPHRKALVVPLNNPGAVVSGQAAKFGIPALLDLGGRGIRSIELIDAAYLIVAGPAAEAGTFALFRWSGAADDAPVLVKGIDFKSLRPEALFEIPASHMLQLLSDDGSVEIDGVACKDRDAAYRSFRSISIERP